MPVSVAHKSTIAARREVVVQMLTDVKLNHDVPACAEPITVTDDKMKKTLDVNSVWRHVLVARTACNWEAGDKHGPAMVQSPTLRS